MHRGFLHAIALLCFVFIASAAFASANPFPVVGRQAPDFTLVDQQGRKTALIQFRGKLVLLNFIYTHCVDICPITTASLQRVQQDLIKRGWWATDVVFVSVTTDPERDTPPVLQVYARRYRIDSRGWYFLTGHPKVVRKVHAAYGVSVRPQSKGLQVHHLPTFVINRRGLVLGVYGVNPNPCDVLSDLEHLR